MTGGRWLDTFRLRGESSVDKTVLLALSTFLVLSATGSIYGWAPLLLVLQETGAYSELCESTPADSPTLCEAQDLRLNLIYTAALMSTGLTTMAWGVMVDWLGSRIVLMLSAVFFGTGCVLFAFSDSKGFDAYVFGFILIATGGSGLFYGIVRSSEMFGKHRVTVVGIYSVAFDASAVVFPLYGIVYKTFGLPLQDFFLLYSSIALLVLLCALMWPLSSPRINEELIEEASRTTDVAQLDDESDKPSQQPIEETLPLLAGVWDAKKVRMSERPFKVQIRSVDYWAFVAFVAVSVIWINMYIGTVTIQLERLTTDQATVDFYVEVFSWILPAVFVVGPLIGWSVDKAGALGSIVMVQISALLFAVVKMVPILEVQFITFVVVSLYRAIFYTATIAALLELFGFANFGKLWGLCVFVGGGLNYLQQPFLELAYVFGSFYYIDLVQLCCMLVLSLYPLFLWRRLPRLT